MAELAEKVGVVESSVAHWEKGTNGAAAGTVKKLAEVFGEPISSFLEDEVIRKTADDIDAERKVECGVQTPRKPDNQKPGGHVNYGEHVESAGVNLQESGLAAEANRLIESIRQHAPEKLAAPVEMLRDIEESARRKKK